MTTVAESIVAALGDLGVRTIWGVVGDALNPVTDAIRRDDRLTWIGTRHEEAAAFAPARRRNSPERSSPSRRSRRRCSAVAHE